MVESWKDDNCAAMKAHYAVYSVPHAAALWCGVPEDSIPLILSEATQLSPSGFGRGVWIHPNVPCLEPRTRAIAEAIESDSLPHGREDAQTVENDHVAYERRHIFGRDLKKWMEKAFPNEKPAFLFDDIEQNSHTSITAESYRSLKADRDALKNRIDKAIEEFKILRQEKETIETDRDSLRGIVDKSVEAEKSLSTKERHTLLVIIAALCKEANIDYSQRGVASAIQNLTENIGSPITDDTIRSVLKQINEAVDVRSK